MNVNDIDKKQMDLLRQQLKHTQLLCKAIWDNRSDIEEIKYGLLDDELYAKQVWNELDYPVQKLLITAPTKGGPFTTAERAQIKALWEITAEDMENV